MALTLTVRNLGVEFGPKKILHDISFDVAAGELVSITAVSYTHLTLPTIRLV